MWDESSNEEGAEEAIEDLEAPADAQADVAGGACPKPTAMGCELVNFTGNATCNATEAKCTQQSGVVLVREQ